MREATSPEVAPELCTPGTGAVLPRAFYERSTVEVARDLLGRFLVLETADSPIRVGKLVEVEAYLGERDRASHAWHGKTARTAPMFEDPGHAYVYRIYGMYWCLNVVTEPPGHATAILLRAVEPVVGLDQSTDGPGKLCRAYGITGAYNRADLTTGALRITAGNPVPGAQIATSPRIGVDYAEAWKDEPLRFFVAGNRFVSRPRAAHKAHRLD
jgi:DNA-3-methyladenine glycosylase